MISEEIQLSPSAQAVLFEINERLQLFIDSGQTWSIFTNKMSLTPEDRQGIRDFLGRGSVTIHLTDSAEPAEWMESGTPGVWYGVFYDQTQNPILETIEIGSFPQVPGAQIEDVEIGIEILKKRLMNNKE
ncbi:hydrogenase expression/formation C-terminal domain-containing protein [Pelosinus sp. sgz500959]|uniref:hydrogenase expression/formation C-terminal domain-containing protein n=1 Tax=Pelosinus sp. sgz500959 TaxID=3242472 RepID=UPI00366D5940